MYMQHEKVGGVWDVLCSILGLVFNHVMIKFICVSGRNHVKVSLFQVSVTKSVKNTHVSVFPLGVGETTKTIKMLVFWVICILAGPLL